MSSMALKPLCLTAENTSDSVSRALCSASHRIWPSQTMSAGLAVNQREAHPYLVTRVAAKGGLSGGDSVAEPTDQRGLILRKPRAPCPFAGVSVRTLSLTEKVVVAGS